MNSRLRRRLSMVRSDVAKLARLATVNSVGEELESVLTINSRVIRAWEELKVPEPVLKPKTLCEVFQSEQPHSTE